MKLNSTWQIRWSLLLMFLVLSFYIFMLGYEICYPFTNSSGIRHLGFGIYTYSKLGPDSYGGFIFPHTMLSSDGSPGYKVECSTSAFDNLKNLFLGFLLLWYLSLGIFLLLLNGFFKRLNPSDIFTESSVKGIKRIFHCSVYLTMLIVASGFVLPQIVTKIIGVHVFSNAMSLEFILILCLLVILNNSLMALGYYFNNGYRLKTEQALTI